MIRGMPQAVEYESSASRLSYTVTDDTGVQRKPDAAPTITLYDASGDELVAATSMTAQTAVDEGYLAYDAQTTEFGVGETITGGTSAATGRIMADERLGASGVLRLSRVDGTFQNNEALTDTGGGAATSDETLYLAEYYYDVDASDTDTWEIGTAYFAEIEYEISSRAYKRMLYFDVAYTPMCYPIVTSADIDELRSPWVADRPQGWADWSPAIRRAHASIVRRIHSHGEMAAEYVRREDEFWDISFAFICREIGRSCGFSTEMQDTLDKDAEAAWRARGLLTTNRDKDPELEEEKSTIQSRLLR